MSNKAMKRWGEVYSNASLTRSESVSLRIALYSAGVERRRVMKSQGSSSPILATLVLPVIDELIIARHGGTSCGSNKICTPHFVGSENRGDVKPQDCAVLSTAIAVEVGFTYRHSPENRS